MIYFVIFVFCLIVVTAYITTIICKYVHSSEWQEISYTGSSIAPNTIYICKHCNNKADVKYHHCSNCGAIMMNGPDLHYYSNEIKLGEEGG